MKIILLIAGIILSVWVSITVYTPVNNFVGGVKEVYLQSKAIERTAIQKSGIMVNTITEAYQEMTRMFGMDVATEKAKDEIMTPTKVGDKDVIERLFNYNIALWISVIAGLLTLSIYFNIISFIAFFMKPITFLMKK